MCMLESNYFLRVSCRSSKKIEADFKCRGRKYGLLIMHSTFSNVYYALQLATDIFAPGIVRGT